MAEENIDDLLRSAASAPNAVDPAILERISGRIGSSIKPVRPLAPAWQLSAGVFFVCMLVAIAGAELLGMHGVRSMSLLQIALIFPVLAVSTWIAAVSSVRVMTPGSAPLISSYWLPVWGSVLLAVLFAALFPDHGMTRFVPSGLVCLKAGLLHAIPAGLACWLLLRRGYAVNRLAAGVVIGALASSAGITMLELHCANFELLHIAVWHTAVLPVAAAGGALLAQAWPAKRQAHH
jgi:hypothetical protein